MATSVAMVVLAGVGAWAAGVWSQQNKSAVIFRADVRAVRAIQGGADWYLDLWMMEDNTCIVIQ